MLKSVLCTKKVNAHSIHPEETNCNVNYFREILAYLITMRMIHGSLPKDQLLDKYNLNRHFHDLVLALRRGDLRQFERVLEQNQAFYMCKELYLIIQLHLRNLVLRSFFKKTYPFTLRIMQCSLSRDLICRYLLGMALGMNVDGRLNLRLVERVFHIIGMTDVDMDEVECITASLIFNVIKQPVSLDGNCS